MPCCAPKKGRDRFRPAWRTRPRARHPFSAAPGHSDFMTTDAYRVAASVLFTVALVACLVLRVLRWRRARSGRPWAGRDPVCDRGVMRGDREG